MLEKKYFEIERMASIAAKKYVLRYGGEYDDAKSESFIFLLSLLKRFPSERQNFYIKSCYNHLIDKLRREHRFPRIALEFEIQEAANYESPDRIVEKKESAALILRKIEVELNRYGKEGRTRDRKIIQEWIRGKQQSLISIDYKITKQRVNQIIAAFKKKLSETLKANRELSQK